jgi:DUF1365 family protein
MWLTDLDDIPQRSRIARLLRDVHPGDHLGDPSRSLRENVHHFLGLNGIEPPHGKVLMLSQARGLGFAFDPISVYWCHSGSGELSGVLLEVRNTFGDRHCYLVHPDDSGRAEFAKELYVSPYFPVAGTYVSRTHLDQRSVRVHLTLNDLHGKPALVATLNGVPAPASRWRDLLATLGNPIAARLTLRRIHAQSRRLSALGLPTRRRRTHPPQPGSTRER